VKKFLVVVVALGLALVGCDNAGGGDGAADGKGVEFGDSSNSGDSGDGGPTGAVSEIDRFLSGYESATGAITTVHVVVDQKITGGGQSATSHFEIDMDAQAGAFAATGNMTGISFTMTIVDGRAYVDMGGMTQDGTLAEMGLSEADLNPASEIRRQSAAVTSVEMVGSENVGGVNTQHYVITYDAAEMNKILDEKQAGGTVAGDTVTADVWLDDQMRPMKYQTTMTVSASGVTASVTQTALYSDYGKPVNITRP